MTTERHETRDRGDPHAAPVSTAGWPYTLRSDFPPGAMHRTLFADVRLAGLPAAVREQLRALGCGPWLDDPDETVTLEAEIVGTEERGGVVGPRYGPRPHVPLAELVARIRSGPTPAARRDQEKERREFEESRRAEALARQRAQDEARLAAARERAAREAEEARRQQNLVASVSVWGEYADP
jgi:hypothetical protein